MTLSQLVIAGAVVAIVLLIAVVVKMSGQLAQLLRQVSDLQSAPEPAPPQPSTPTVAVEPVATSHTIQPVVERDEDVSVITHLDEDRGGDLTTTRIASVVLGGPLIKVAAFSHGVRRALREEHRMKVAYVVRKEMRRQRKIRRRRRCELAPRQGRRP